MSLPQELVRHRLRELRARGIRLHPHRCDEERPLRLPEQRQQGQDDEDPTARPESSALLRLQCVVDDFFPAQVGAPGEEHCEDCAAEEAEDAA